MPSVTLQSSVTAGQKGYTSIAGGNIDITLFSTPNDSTILLISLSEDAILHVCSSSVDENKGLF